MTINYRSLNGADDKELQEHFNWLTSGRQGNYPGAGKIGSHGKGPSGYESYHTVDVMGKELVWMNETFPKDTFTWYLWFESVFLVPEEMLPFLQLRWS